MPNGQKQIPIQLDPNMYAVSNVNVRMSEDSMEILIVSGIQGRQFQFDPKHAKRFYLLLKKYIEQYEKDFGELKTELPKQNLPQFPNSQNAAL